MKLSWDDKNYFQSMESHKTPWFQTTKQIGFINTKSVILAGLPSQYIASSKIIETKKTDFNIVRQIMVPSGNLT